MADAEPVAGEGTAGISELLSLILGSWRKGKKIRIMCTGPLLSSRSGDGMEMHTVFVLMGSREAETQRESQRGLRSGRDTPNTQANPDFCPASVGS